MKMPTSGSCGFTAAVAAMGSLQAAKSGAIAANIKTMHADCVRSPDIESIAPVQVGKRELSIRDVVVRRRRKRSLELTVDDIQDRASLLRRNTVSRRPNVTRRYRTELSLIFPDSPDCEPSSITANRKQATGTRRLAA